MAELDRLKPGSTAVVIGTGGLGHVAIQILHALSAYVATTPSRDKITGMTSTRMDAS